MNGNKSEILVISEITDEYAESITPKLRLALQLVFDTFWEINSDADLYLWYGLEKKYYLIRWRYGFYISNR